MFLKRIPLYFIFLIICVNKIVAQEYKFKHITADEGLSVGVVNCILQDSRGFMWFGTQDGLNRYDGYTIKVFKHNPVDTNSVSNNFILSLYQDKNNLLWIGTKGGGLDEYNLSTGKFKHHKNVKGNTNSISNDNVRAIMQDKDNLLWFGTDDGLNSYDFKTNNFTRYKADLKTQNAISSDSAWCIYNTKDGMLWIGTQGGGLNCFDKQTNTFQHFKQPVRRGKSAQENINKIKTIYEDEEGILWLGTDGEGIQQFDRDKKKFIKSIKHNEKDKHSLSNNQVYSITGNRNGQIWIGTYGKGVDIYNNKTDDIKNISFKENENDGFDNNQIECIYFDATGSLWIGTEGKGVYVNFQNTDKFITLKKRYGSKNSIQSNIVMAVIKDKDGLIWIGTNQGGLSTYNPRTDSYIQHPELTTTSTNTIFSLCEDNEGIIWVGTNGGGLNSYNKKNQKITSFPQFQNANAATVLNIYQDSKENLWIGTYGAGVFEYDKTNKKFINYNSATGLNNDIVICTYEDRAHNIWIGTDGGGLNKYNTSDKKFKYYVHNEKKNSLSSNTVNCIYEDKKNNIWIATANGLNKLNTENEHFDYYFEKDGLPNDYIYSILADGKENLWMSTNKGVSKFNTEMKNENGSAFKNYDVHDGLQGLEFNQGSYFKSKKGELFLGGVNGLNIFNPDSIKDNTHIPPVQIISYKRSGREVYSDTLIYDKKVLNLSWRENFFSFDFAGLDYQMPAKNMYRYKLEGVDPDWSLPSNLRYASYTELGGGDFVFRVIASNNDGVWNTEGASLIIHINPPFWKTNWFYFLCGLVVIAGFWLFFSNRTRAIKKENKILEEKVEERTIELAQKNKDITSSIEYAQRIQLAILPPLELIKKAFPESFVLYNPKDIVSGDFYWFGIKNGKKIIAVVDCTGHGVPGAFMSMIGHNLLNQIIIEKGITQPDEILNVLHKGVETALHQGTNVVETSDGMDIAICTIDNDNTILQYAGAFRPLIIINNEKINKTDGDKFPIGGLQFDSDRKFTCHTFALNKGDSVYLSTDGYADQFGGNEGRKFMVKHFHKLLLSIQNVSLEEQNTSIENTIIAWKGNYEQVDDILVIGIRF